MAAGAPHLSVNGAPLLLFRSLSGLILPYLKIAELPLKATEALEPLLGERSLGDRRENRAPGLAPVSAVREAALRREGGDVLKRPLEALL